MINKTSDGLKARILHFQKISFYEQVKFHDQFKAEHEKSFITSGPLSVYLQRQTLPLRDRYTT